MPRRILQCSAMIFIGFVVTVVLGRFTAQEKEQENRFMDWLKSNGADVSLVELAHFPLGRGVRARSNIYFDDNAFVIPLHLILNVEAAFKSPVGPALRQLRSDLGLFSSKVLPIFVAYEMLKGEDSFWAPYFALLSPPYDIPLYWRLVCILLSAC